MKKRIFYGDEMIAVELPDATMDVPTLDPFPAIKKLEEAIEEALENPIAHEPLHEIVKPGSKVNVIGNTGFDLLMSPVVPTTKPPTKEQLRIIRKLVEGYFFHKMRWTAL